MPETEAAKPKNPEATNIAQESKDAETRNVPDIRPNIYTDDARLPTPGRKRSSRSKVDPAQASFF